MYVYIYIIYIQYQKESVIKYDEHHHPYYIDKTEVQRAERLSNFPKVTLVSSPEECRGVHRQSDSNVILLTTALN